MPVHSARGVQKKGIVYIPRTDERTHAYGF